MKEFKAQAGGRYIYNDDINNLQDLALSMTQLLNGCDNCIVSGCEATAGGISDGFVYINGKIRQFSKISGSITFPCYLVETNQIETVGYANGQSNTGRIVYGCSFSQTLPTDVDSVTKSARQYILIKSIGGGTRIGDALFGKYSLSLGTSSTVQTVHTSATFDSPIRFTSDLMAYSGLMLNKGASNVAYHYVDNNNRYTITANGSKIVFGPSAIQYSINNKQVGLFDTNSFQLSVPTKADKMTAGMITMTANQIYDDIDSTDSGTIKINMISKDGSTKNGRNTIIGDGKGNALINVVGKDKKADINASITVSSPAKTSMSFKSTKPQDDTTLTNTIQFVDNADKVMAIWGYETTTTTDFMFQNKIGGINIVGFNGVNIAPNILEAGTLLSEKYVLTSKYNQDMSKVTTTDNVYTRTQADGRFAVKNNGFVPFIDETNTKEKLRQQIDAYGIEDVKKLCPTLDNKLTDMAKSESDKRDVCSNIGAAFAQDVQPKLVNEDWKTTSNPLVKYKRYGDLIIIEGYPKGVAHGQVLFTIPKDYAPNTPKHYSFTSIGADRASGLILGSDGVCTVDQDSKGNLSKTSFPISFIYFK